MVGVCVGVGHTTSPFKTILHSSQSLNNLYEVNGSEVLGIPLEITVQALKPSSVVNKKVFWGLLINIFKRLG